MTNDHHHDCCGGDHHHGHAHSHHPAEGHADLDGPAGSPILIEVTRGGMVESVHRGRAAVVDARGGILAQWGDVRAPVYARSSVKPLQAIPLVETGAADAFAVTTEELALACASHNGEERHTRVAGRWLARMGLTPADLECGAQIPYDVDSGNALLLRGEAPSTLHNNCSGKHTGFLATALHKGEPTKGYVRYDHPVQQRILGVMEQMTGQDLSRAPWGIDGCSIPTIGIPLEAVAYAMARIADPRDLPERRAQAVTRIREAWAAHPYLIAGRDTFDTAIMEAAGGAVLVKQGAEGFGVAVLPGLGLGVALKIDDGASRARDIAMGALIRSLRAVDDALWATAPGLTATPITSRAGAEVGTVRAALAWPPAAA